MKDSGGQDLGFWILGFANVRLGRYNKRTIRVPLEASTGIGFRNYHVSCLTDSKP